MLDENEVCEEVTALLDRMDKFPEEFLDDYRLDQRWGRIVRIIGDEHNNKDVFTSAELRLLQEKLKGLVRVRMKREILENIMRVEKDEETERFNNLVYNATKGRAAQAVSISEGTGSVNAVWLNPYEDKIKKMEEDQRNAMQEEMMRAAREFRNELGKY
jgi:hypothetical protein